MSEEIVGEKLLELIELIDIYVNFEEISANEEAKIMGGYANEYLSITPSFVTNELLSLLKKERNIEEMTKSYKNDIHSFISTYNDMDEGENEIFDLIYNLSEDKKRFDSLNVKEIREITSRFIKEYFGEKYFIAWKNR